MNHHKLKPFLDAVFKLARERCGSEFESVVTKQRLNREKFLSSIWSENMDGSPQDSELILREIDFDTIVNISSSYLHGSAYPTFLVELGELGLRYGQIDKARELFKRILVEYDGELTQQMLGNVNQFLGEGALYQSDLDAALEYFQKAKSIHENDNDHIHYASALNAEGTIHAEKGETQTAFICFKEAHAIAQRMDNRDMIMQTSMNLANLSHSLGNYQESMIHLHSTKLLIDKDDAEMLAKVNHNLGITHKALNHTELSLKCFDQAITYAETSQDFYLRTLSFLEKSEVLCRKGEVQEGAALLTTAFQAFSEYGDRLGMADSYKVFGTLSGQRDAKSLATSFFENSLRIAKSMGNNQGLGETYTALGDFYRDDHQPEKAIESYNAAIQSYESMQAEARVIEVRQVLEKIRLTK